MGWVTFPNHIQVPPASRLTEDQVSTITGTLRSILG